MNDFILLPMKLDFNGKTLIKVKMCCGQMIHLDPELTPKFLWVHFLW